MTHDVDAEEAISRSKKAVELRGDGLGLLGSGGSVQVKQCPKA